MLSTKLGVGASAEVWAAEHRLTEEIAAIKVFLSTGSEAIHAAATEFVCAMRSSSPHALEYRTLAFIDGAPALVMEMAEVALSDWIQVHLLAPCVKITNSNMLHGPDVIESFSLCLSEQLTAVCAEMHSRHWTPRILLGMAPISSIQHLTATRAERGKVATPKQGSAMGCPMYSQPLAVHAGAAWYFTCTAGQWSARVCGTLCSRQV